MRPPVSTGAVKSVIYLPVGMVLTDTRKRDAMLELGDVIDSLGTAYVTAEDVGTSAELIAIIAERTEHVCGLPVEQGGVGEPAGATASGIYASIVATAEALFGSREIDGRHIVISGLGEVRGRLATALSRAGAKLTVTDVNLAKNHFARELGVTWVDVADALRVQATCSYRAAFAGCSPRAPSADSTCSAWLVRPTTSSPSARARPNSRLAASSGLPTSS